MGFLPQFAVCYHVPEVVLTCTRDQNYGSGKARGKIGVYFAEETAYCGTHFPASACRKVGQSFPLAWADFAAKYWEIRYSHG